MHLESVTPRRFNTVAVTGKVNVVTTETLKQIRALADVDKNAVDVYCVNPWLLRYVVWRDGDGVMPFTLPTFFRESVVHNQKALTGH